MSTPAPMMTPPDVARRLRVDVHRVLDWIRSGRLVAIDVRRPGSTRPRYRVAPEALEDLLRLLTVSPPPPRPRRKPRLDGVRRYFDDLGG